MELPPDPPPRVRVAFLGSVGRHVQRLRGFSACWWLPPRGSRLVGDLALALLRDFELLARCPRGVELAVDGLRVPLDQAAQLVRDGDRLAVQAAAASALSSSSDEEEEEEEEKMPRRRKAERRKEARKSRRGEGKSGKRKMEGKAERKAEAKAAVEDKDSSSSSSSDSDSSSNSSDDESDRSSAVKAAKQPQAAKKPSPAAAASTEQDDDADDDADAEARPRRRRRRQRRRKRDGNAERPASLEQAQRTEPVEVPTASPTQSPPVEPRTRFPRSKAHFRFDATTSDVSGESREVGANDGMHQNQQAPTGLEKYGPSQAISEENTGRQGVNTTSAQATNGQRRRREADNGSDFGQNGGTARRKKPKKMHEEFWKRPYEVLATVFDKPNGEVEKSVVSWIRSRAPYRPLHLPCDFQCDYL